MAEATGAERPPAAWLENPRQQIGARLLPLAVERQRQSAERAEVCGEPLWPSDFSDDSMDIFTNFLCYGSGSEGHVCLTTYCFLDTKQLKNKNMMSLESLSQILGWALSEPGHIKTVSLLGGEFALHPDAKEIIRRVWTAGFNIRIVTNGSEQFQALLDDDDIVGMLRDETRDNLVAVSLDSITEADNDKNRGPGATKLALATVAKLNRPEQEIPFRINATPLLNCVDGLPALYKCAEKLRARRVVVHYPDAVGRGRSLVPGPQSHKAPRQPDPDTWVKVRAAADTFNRSHPSRKGFVRCERGFAEVLHCHMSERRSSLHFAPQVSDEQGLFVPVGGCAFSMESIDTDSAYTLRGGELNERKGPSQLNTVRQLLGKTASCPLYPGRGCIYE